MSVVRLWKLPEKSNGQSNTERDKKAFEFCHGLITITSTKVVVYFKNGADSGRGCFKVFWVTTGFIFGRLHSVSSLGSQILLPSLAQLIQYGSFGDMA